MAKLPPPWRTVIGSYWTKDPLQLGWTSRTNLTAVLSLTNKERLENPGEKLDALLLAKKTNALVSMLRLILSEAIASDINLKQLVDATFDGLLTSPSDSA